jgi:serine/threonine-protein kinase
LVGDKRREPDAGGEKTEVEPPQLPSPPRGVSRIDTLPADFIQLLSRRPLQVGDVIGGRFRLKESLGDGSMGQVFVAENLSIGRLVAVKVLKAELLAQASFRTRFQHEAMAIAAIEHRNVARFFDLVVGDPTFLVMEYVPGPTLAAVLSDESRIEVARAVRIATRLAWALDAAHAAGVIHRDVKPANVMLATDRELGEEPKLIDFGLAKLATLPPEAQLTRTGQLVGTPHYMSPEQIGNKGVDARSDVYSLGCLLHHMVAARPPFLGEDDMQVLYQQVQRDAEPLRRQMPELPLALDAVLMTALAKDPARRFQTMKQMIEALARVDVRGTPKEAPAPPVDPPRDSSAVTAPPPPPVPSRRPAGLLAVGAVVGAVAAAGVVGWRQGASSRTLLVVTSRPNGARVELDGKPIAETTPTSIRGISPGAHRLRLEQAGRDPTEQVVMVGAGERTAIEGVLPPRSHQIPVTTVPAGAIVYLDGDRVPGETPLTLSIADDDIHELRFEKAGSEPEKMGLPPEQTAPLVVTLVPEKEPRGYVSVDSNDAAEVVIDGKATSYMTPTLGIAVKAGQHTIALEDGTGATSPAVTVTVGIGETKHLVLSAPGARARKGGGP